MYLHTLSTEWLQILNLFGVVFPKYQKVSSTDLVNKCFEICLWILLTMVRSLPLNTALPYIRVAAVAFNCSYASLVTNIILNLLTVCVIRLHLRNPPTNFADSTYICGLHLHIVKITYILRKPLTVAESRATSYICLLRNPQQNNVSTKFTLQIYVCGIHWNFVCRIHLHFGTFFKICLWNPGTYRQKCAPIQCTVWPRDVPLFW